MKIPHPDKKSIDLFKSLVPDDPHITIRPMFGNLSAFVNGNVFFGLYGNDLFLRLSSQDQQELLKQKGAAFLEPMKGRPMKDYVITPRDLEERCRYRADLGLQVTRLVQQTPHEEGEKIESSFGIANPNCLLRETGFSVMGVFFSEFVACRA